MVSAESVQEQLKAIHFNITAWGRTEANELPNILIPDEQIYECVNGIYEGGFALLVATNLRVLLVDKKPMNYLTVEDLRFDMINELDYSHRLIGAQISISAGNKNLKFRSYNQGRLRKLINHVQHCMAEIKKQQAEHQYGQNTHLEQINQQLQAYLVAQYQNQEELSRQLYEAKNKGLEIDTTPNVVQPSPELADYLFAQSLLQQQSNAAAATTPLTPAQSNSSVNNSPTPDDLYNEGVQEVFGKRTQAQPYQTPTDNGIDDAQADSPGIDVNPMRIAYSKLPMALRNRKFNRASTVKNNTGTTLTSPPTRIANAHNS